MKSLLSSKKLALSAKLSNLPEFNQKEKHLKRCFFLCKMRNHKLLYIDIYNVLKKIIYYWLGNNAAVIFVGILFALSL